MIQIIKKNAIYMLIIISIVLIFIQCLIIGSNFFILPSEIMNDLPDGNIRLFYEYFFKVIGQPLIQAISLALLFMVYVYFISLILYGVAWITKVKINFNRVIEVFILSYSVIVLRKIIEIIYFLIYEQSLNNLIINFVFAIALVLIYCKIIKRYTMAEKLNNIIYNSLIILGTVIFNGTLIALKII